jgi:MoaD family protein
MPVVKFFANLRQVTGLKEKDQPGENLRQVLEALAGEFPTLGEYLSGAAGSRLIITLNGHPLDPRAGWDVPLAETDQVAIFPPIAGG